MLNFFDTKSQWVLQVNIKLPVNGHMICR